MTAQELKFEPEAIEFLKTAEHTKMNIYLTWKAGAGKSTQINFFLTKTKKKCVLLWTTWISAINIWWQTIHKFFWIIPKKEKNYMTADNKKIFRECDVVLIDEVSMLRADWFDQIDRIAQSVMNNNKFLWWKQFILVGDLFQLPPVPEQDEELRKYYEQEYKWLFFFNSKSYVKENFKVIELKKVYRQDDIQFVWMLNRVRIWDKAKDILNYFNDRVVEQDQINPKAILIWTTNNIVNTKNALELSKLPWPESISVAYISWDYPVDIYPTDKIIKIKKWARIMFTINHKDWFYVNWTLWTIIDINNNDKWYIQSVKIETDDWDILDVWKNQWINSPWDDKYWEPIIDWTFSQLPFKLAFAITIHKVQWKSFDNVVIDLWWGAFAPWQVYVALSRCRSYWWLQLLKPIEQKDIKVDYSVIKYLRQ